MGTSLSSEKKKEIAKYYLETLGWSLLPMDFITDDSGDTIKKPMVKWKDFQMTRPSLEEVYGWIDKGWFLGMITGVLSGIDVLDDDRAKNGKEPLNVRSLVTAKTRSGGFHHYFKHKPGLRNTQGGDQHVDIRGEGGYVVLPPFEDYEWVKKPSKEAIEKLVYISDDMIKKAEPNKWKTVGGGESYSFEELVNVEQGNRDNSMYQLGLKLCNNFPEKDWDTVLNLMHAANSLYKPPLKPNVVEEKFRQASTFVKNHPFEEKEALDAKKIIQQFPVQTYSQMNAGQITKKESRPRLPIGINKVDQRFDFPTGYYVFCANPGAGKGWFALWLIKQYWLLHQQKSVFFSLEMPELLVRSRAQQQWSHLTQEQFESGGNVQPAIDLLQKDIMIVDEFFAGEGQYQTPEMFEAKINHYYDQGYRVFHFDHLHELQGANDNSQNQKVTEKWGRTFQRISKEKQDIWLFIFAQPNGAAALKAFITRTDIAGSKAITQKCDFFLSLNRSTKKNEKGMIEVESEDRNVMLFLDKSRYTSASHIGFQLYFGMDGNFYENDNIVIKTPAPHPSRTEEPEEKSEELKAAEEFLF